jgi:hypothetical protein
MLMDLDLAIAKHSEWKSRLLAVITNNETQTYQVQFMKPPR